MGPPNEEGRKLSKLPPWVAARTPKGPRIQFIYLLDTLQLGGLAHELHELFAVRIIGSRVAHVGTACRSVAPASHFLAVSAFPMPCQIPTGIFSHSSP